MIKIAFREANYRSVYVIGERSKEERINALFSLVLSRPVTFYRNVAGERSKKINATVAFLPR